MGYAIEASPFYKLERKKTLAELLDAPLDLLMAIAKNPEQNYSVFQLKGKKRTVERPKKQLEKAQHKIATLLQRIDPPDYLHSAYKGRSYITNARQHDCSQQMVKIDIRKFFPRSDAAKVYNCFESSFCCSPDVSWLLTQLTTFRGHLPTGGKSSTILAYFAYREMFDKINALANDREVKMTCVVDDMSFSGAKASPEFNNQVAMIIRSYGLTSHKRKHFAPGQPRIVTGVTITTKGLRLPNVRRKKLHQGIQELTNETNPYLRLSHARRLQGMAVAAAQIEAGFDSVIKFAAQEVAVAGKMCPNT